MTPLIKSIRTYWDEHPLASIMILAVIFRLCAVIFAKGYGMHDDHFCVIDTAQKWVDGGREGFGPGTYWRSIVYPGVHYLLFELLQKFGIFDPQIKMYVVRFLHAAFSLVTVFFGYKLVEKMAGRDSARISGLLLAILWLMPFMSVRNLQEFVCIPPMMLGFYYLYKEETNKTFLHALVAGLLFGIAFTVRFQSLSMIGIVGLVLLILKEFRAVGGVAVGFLFAAFLLIGTTDWYAHGIPFKSFYDYVLYNSTHGDAYTTGPFYTYIGLMIGVLIPPLSLLLLFGYLRTWKKYALMFWPVLVFFALHSWFPNKQERFILPIVPFMVILSVIGWQQFAGASAFWLKHKKLLRGLWIAFWVGNTLMLLLATFTYSKKSRCETLSYLYRQPDVTGVIIETTDAGVPLVPLFYLGKKVPVYCMPIDKPLDSLSAEISRGAKPNRVIFLKAERLDERIKRMETLVPGLIPEKTIAPSIADWILYTLNPKHNVNQTSYIYKVYAKEN